jgi:small-conductance mechanosensitive channel
VQNSGNRRTANGIDKILWLLDNQKVVVPNNMIWDVYWDITRTVKERFDAEGVSIPFPQRDVHMHQAATT